MGGKGPIFAVLGLGLVASICAAVLMAAMRSKGTAPAVPTKAEVLVVAADLPAMTRLEQSHLEVREVELKERPKESYSDPVQILGRVLKVPLVAGQPVTDLVLLSDEEGAKLASSLPEGYRAVSIDFPSSSAMKGLLYPGCRVDVIVAYKRGPARFADAGPASRTLLQNVSVLAVEDKTLFTVEPEPDGEDPKPAPSTRSVSRTLMVTLMVDPQQARDLQAARDQGELALTLRNPLDDSLTAEPDPAAGQPAPETVAAPVRPAGPWRVVVVRGDKTEVQVFGESGEAEGDRFADAPTDEPAEIDE
jgi:pilus assembly protein CpaB